MPDSCCIGIDLGTSGCRGVAIDRQGNALAEASALLPPSLRAAPGHAEQEPADWWQAVQVVLGDLISLLRPRRVAAVAVDGTSSTLLLCDRSGTPLGPALMYDDTRSRQSAERIDRVAPPRSAARGPSSGLAKLLHLIDTLKPQGAVLALHQADWVLGRLCGRFGVGDWNNALKLGYEPGTERWAPWISRLGVAPSILPQVLPPGTVAGTLRPDLADALGLDRNVLVCTGTTDSTAAVLATGASRSGDAVTVLGTTLVVKVLSARPVTASEYGVYSHRVDDLWLVGGASNTGGGALRTFFSDWEIQALSAALHPTESTGLDYYPLPSPGERFPIDDPGLQPRLEPRPAEDWRFFQGILEGIARIEADGYALLQRLGAPASTRVFSIGGGAENAGWTQIRARMLGVPVLPPAHRQAAYGAALLALRGLEQSGAQPRQ